MPGHTVPEQQHLAAGDPHGHCPEEGKHGCLTFDSVGDDVPGVGSVELKTVPDPATGRIAERRLVALDSHVVAAVLGLVLDPVENSHPTDKLEAALAVPVSDAVADQVPLWRAAHELLGPIRREILQAVDPDFLEQAERIRPAQEQLGHVVRLVHQDRGLTPCLLLFTPVRELRRDV